MTQNIIVGGGISGLLTAHVFRRQGLSFLGLEKGKKLGGRSLLGHHRLYQDTSVGFLKELTTDIEWIQISDTVMERKKGAWEEVTDESHSGDGYYLGGNFYHPKQRFDSLVKNLKDPVESSFQFEKFVQTINPSQRMVTCQDGTKFEYDSLIWTADLPFLLKSIQDGPVLHIKSLKKIEEAPGEILLEMELKRPLFTFSNSVLVPFRYKDYKLRAIGINEPSEATNPVVRMHWMLFLERELVEDREEVAKIIRSLKRELNKEFPELKELVIREKIVFSSSVAGENRAELKSLEICPRLFYVGPQSRLSNSSNDNMNLDLTIENCKQLEETLRANA